ncbi:hypothetical protein [Oceanithermus sp.]|uniref:hypothetical protein n=1 Tax=Oceanithermus sp. TaxID=2268145 RepID=UPI00257987A4|nr:hypothetical protein [Oceanithermus sp.]
MGELIALIERLDLAKGLPYLLAARAGELENPPVAWLMWEQEGLVEGRGLTAKGEAVVHHLLGLAEALDVAI